MEQFTESGSDDENANTNDVNDQKNQLKRTSKQEMGNNASVEAGGSKSSLAGSNNQPKSRSRSPSTSKKTIWKSANPFINYVQDFKQNQVEYPNKMSGSNLFRLASEQWRLMSQEEKQPYIDGAALIKKQKASSSSKETNRAAKTKAAMKFKNSDTASKNKKTNSKSKSRTKRKKQQGLFLKVTDSENESDSKSSDVEV